MNNIPDTLIIVAGRHAYPLMLAKAARAAGVKRIAVVGFKGETRREIIPFVDEMHWVRLGAMREFLDKLNDGRPDCAGQPVQCPDG